MVDIRQYNRRPTLRSHTRWTCIQRRVVACDVTFMWQVHVIVQEIFLNGAVHKDGRLFPGDQLVTVRRYPASRLGYTELSYVV